MSKEREASLDKLSLNQYAPARVWGARLLPLALLLDLAAVPAAAQNFHWDGGTVNGGNPAANANGGTGTWNTTITNWDTAATGGASTAWVNGNNNAFFGGTGGTVTLGVPVTAQNVTFTVGGYTLAGNTLTLGGTTPTITGTGTISSVIAGTAGMTTGGGNATLTLSAANTFTGPLTITHGVTAVSTGSVILAPGGSLATSAVTIGTAASSGPVTVVVLQNQGNNQLTNATVTFNAVPTRWAYWQLLGTSQSVLGVVDSAAAGVIEGTESQIGIGNSTLTLTGSGSYSFNGFMRNTAGGSGTLALVKSGTGTQTLSGALINYTGATTVSGGTLSLSNATAYRSATTVNSGTTLELAGNTNVAHPAAFSLTLNDGSTLNDTSTAFNTFNDSNVAINGTVGINVTNNGVNNQLFIGGTSTGLTGSGTINVTNTGSATTGVTFRGNGTFSGTMNVSGGVVNIGTFNVLAGPLALQNTDLNLTNSARLNLAGAAFATATNASVKTLSGNSTATVTLGGQTLTLGTNNGTGATFAGVISGTGALVKTGTGTQTLTGSNTYTGTTTISAGTLQVGDGGTSGTLGTGAIIDNASLVFNRSNTLTVANAISGTGSLTQAGSGTTILTGAKTYSGGTFLNAGTLQVSSDANLGNAAGGLTFNGGTLRTTATFGTTRTTTLNAGGGTFETQAGTTLTQGGAISGAGALTKTGAGTLLLTDAATYTGGTTISAGTLQLGNGGTSGSIVGDVLNNGTLTFNRSDTSTFDGVISGTGSVVQAGSGTLILSADHDYTGGTTINAGTLQIGNGGATGSVVGNIANNSALAFNRSDDVTYGGVISGTGSLTQAGSGQLTLTGTNTFTGGTTVNAGLLTVNGSLASGVNVLGGGSLGGTGTIGGNVTVSGTISPGNSIGTINIVGNYIQNPGSTYQVELNAAGQSDLISITGNATINGGTVAVQAGSVARNAIYTIVTATGSVAGAYSGLSSNFAFLTPLLSYDARNVYLTFQTAFAGGAQSGNQKAVGAALDQVSPSATGDLDTAVNALANLTTQQGLPALEAISGQPYADFGTMNVNNGALFMNALAQQMAMARGGAAAPASARRWPRPAISLPAMGSARGAPGRVRWADWARCWATAIPARSPTTSAAPRQAWTTASTRASWSASASATPMARSG